MLQHSHHGEEHAFGNVFIQSQCHTGAAAPANPQLIPSPVPTPISQDGPQGHRIPEIVGPLETYDGYAAACFGSNGSASHTPGIPVWAGNWQTRPMSYGDL